MSEHAEQQQQIGRVRTNLADLIIAFWKRRLANEAPDFHGDDLRRAILTAANTTAAPASPDRILRDLRQRKRINYVVVSRSRSLYRALPLDRLF